jgi:hypothetical protein
MRRRQIMSIVLVWQDEGSEVVTGARHEESAPVNSTTYTPGSEHRLDTRGGHRLTVAGHLDTSHGRVATTVNRALAGASVHRWTEDALKAGPALCQPGPACPIRLWA